MEHYRLVGASDRSATRTTAYNRGLIATAEGTLGSNVTGFVTETQQCNSDVTVPATSRTSNGSTVSGHVCLSQGAVDYLQPTEPRQTKIFERVPGATVEGTGPANTTLTAQVEMQMEGSNETFTYRQMSETDDDGSFTMTVPYATTGYDEWNPDNGHTNVSVRANSSYEFQTLEQADNGTVYMWSDSANVSEGQVIGQDTSETTVDMERSTFYDPDQQNTSENETATNETDSETDGETAPEGGETSGNETSDSGENTTDGDTDTSESLVAPIAE